LYFLLYFFVIDFVDIMQIICYYYSYEVTMRSFYIHSLLGRCSFSVALCV
jgi:hypothetical protein